MGRDRAAYMREYRAKVRAEREEREMGLVMRMGQAVHDALEVDLQEARARIRALEEEVRTLKAEMERRHAAQGFIHDIPAPTFNTRPFTPVPKHK